MVLDLNYINILSSANHIVRRRVPVNLASRRNYLDTQYLSTDCENE